ncbi:MAG: DUF2252 family protein [Nocardioides sp.]|nr:DUF2252 family protein [Nocardioides sp.]
MTTAGEVTQQYETWLASRIRIDAADLARKHEEMRADTFRFLRGTYYLWLVRIPELAPEALAGTRVPLVGDLHVDNFGTWTDEQGVRRWGVNDLDELARGPWLLDLLRIAVSALVAPHVGLGSKKVCRAVLDAYAEADPGQALDLADTGRARRLRELLPKAADAEKFYADLAGEPLADVPAEVAAAAAMVAPDGWEPTWHHRVAGTGSLGHRRRAGVGTAADGATYAREVKELGPPTAEWASGRDPRLPVPDDALYPAVLTTVAGPAQAMRAADWQVRALAPDIVRLDLGKLDEKGVRRALREMARAAAGVHATERARWRAARHEASSLRPKDFREMVGALVEAVRADHAEFTEHRQPT